MKTRERSSQTTGVLLGAFGYLLWGLFPLYFALLDSVPPIEIIAHRIIWSLLLIVVIVLISRKWRSFTRSFNRRTVIILGSAAILLAINWLVYVYAVSTDQVLQASLGYFINPLISVALGVVILKERLRSMQWLAVAIALIAVIVLGFAYGALPWIGLTLATSFGMYGLLKKFANLPSIQSLGIETALLLPLAIVILAFEFSQGAESIGSDGIGVTFLLIMLGPLTAIPLLAFGGAVTRVPLSTIGLMQYITPIGQFILGILVFHEVMTAGRWVGFVLVWIALVVFSADMYMHTRKNQRDSDLMLSEQAEIEASGA